MTKLFSGKSTVVLIAFFILYVLVVLIGIYFANTVLLHKSYETSVYSSLLIPLFFIISLFLLVFLIWELINLFNEQKKRKQGRSLKFRLFYFFAVIVILSALPQAVISVSFISSAGKAWFSAEFKQALEDSLDIALELYQEKLENLKSFQQSPLYKQSMLSLYANPAEMWKNIQIANPSIDCLQVYRKNDQHNWLFGKLICSLSEESLLNSGNGLLPKRTQKGHTILSMSNHYSSQGDDYIIVLSSMLPKDFDQRAYRLTEAIERTKLMYDYQKGFTIAIALLFSFFVFPLLLLALLISLYLGERIVQPLLSLEDATIKVAEGDYTHRILTYSQDELSSLVNSFNSMLIELERTRIQTLQTEKMTAWQTIAQRLAHEIKNPLTPIKLSAERIIRKFHQDPGELETMLESSVNTIIREVDGLSLLLKEFGDFARLPALKAEKIEFICFIEDLISIYSPSFPLIQFHFLSSLETAMVEIDKQQIKQAVFNIFKNAAEAMEDKGKISLRLDSVRKGHSRFCRLQIRDTGPGISKENQEDVFQPYFTTKKTGTGLGLAIVERIIYDHRGQVWFESQEAKGTVFFIELPLRE